MIERLRRFAGRLPLRVVLVLALVVLAAAGLLASGALVTSSLQSSLIVRVDDSLHEASETWARPREPTRQVSPGGPGPQQPPSDFYVRVSVDGDVRMESHDTLSGDPPNLSAIPDSAAGPITVDSESGAERWRVLVSTENSATDGDTVTTIVALPLDNTEAVVGRLIVLQVVVGLVVLTFLAGFGYLVVRRSLRGLAEVETITAAIADGDMSRRVPERDTRTEVGRLSAAFNVMVGRIAQAFADTAASEATARSAEAAARDSEDRMRRFVADASHELRTPLTTIRGFTELYRQGAITDVDHILQRVEGESQRMGILVEDLLMLARLDSQRPVERTPVDLLRIAGDSVHDARARDPKRSIDLEVFGDHPAVVIGDDARLRQVLTNLVNNAMRHTPADASITVRVGVLESGNRATSGEQPGGDAGHDGPPPGAVPERPARGMPAATAVLEVVDTGQGMTEEQAARVFERFYRADASRSRGSGGGAGLGLSIVRAIVAAHGGRVELSTAPGRGSRFSVLLPGILLPPNDTDPAADEPTEELPGIPAADRPSGHARS